MRSKQFPKHFSGWAGGCEHFPGPWLVPQHRFLPRGHSPAQPSPKSNAPGSQPFLWLELCKSTMVQNQALRPALRLPQFPRGPRCEVGGEMWPAKHYRRKEKGAPQGLTSQLLGDSSGLHACPPLL